MCNTTLPSNQRPTAAGPRPFIPPTPIQVHTLSSSSPPILPLHDHYNDNDNQAEILLPTTFSPPQPPTNPKLIPPPPPAYGRWRGSVRADPELLHWAPSPTGIMAGMGGIMEGGDGEALPSPTYEEVVAGDPGVGPPRYCSPGRGMAGRGEMREIP